MVCLKLIIALQTQTLLAGTLQHVLIVLAEFNPTLLIVWKFKAAALIILYLLD